MATPSFSSMNYESITELRVRYAETDQMGVVYHANYLIWCEVGRTDFIRALGTPYAEFEREGVSLAIAEVALRYHGSARYDDVIRVTTQLTHLRSRAMTFSYRITNSTSGQLLVSGTTGLVALAANGKPTTVPPHMRTLLHSALTTDSRPGVT